MKILIKEARRNGADVLAMLDATYFSINLDRYKESAELIIKTGDNPYYSFLNFTKAQFSEYLEILKKDEFLDLSDYTFQMK